MKKPSIKLHVSRFVDVIEKNLPDTETRPTKDQMRCLIMSEVMKELDRRLYN